ncbi:MAG: hypothetical protein LBU47_01140 [Christensenellaceae bacterium]|jgi:hypothetical protein|nr:hypothetical protein [Christensenellaceae bacterium]
MAKTAFESLKEALDLLENAAPLNFDCGKLCDQACCKDDGGDEPNGMLLFPGEAALYAHQGSWMELYDSELLFEGEPVKLLVCHLPCPRALRPLSCRIFPLFPFLKGDEIKPGMDLRASALCPLYQSGEIGLSREFTALVGQAGLALLQNEKQKAFLRMLSAHIGEYWFL